MTLLLLACATEAPEPIDTAIPAYVPVVVTAITATDEARTAEADVPLGVAWTAECCKLYEGGGCLPPDRWARVMLDDGTTYLHVTCPQDAADVHWSYVQ